MLRGQATTEHVLLLAIVMIIALVVVVLLAGNPNSGGLNLSVSRAYWDNSFPVSISETYQEKGDGTLLVRLKNRGTEQITIVSFETSSGGRINNTYIGGEVSLGPGESKLVQVKAPTNFGDVGEFKVRIRYNVGGIDYTLKGLQPLVVVQSPAVCMASMGKVCTSLSDCCPGGGLSCQGGVCAPCYAGGSLCASDESCCTGSCVPVFGYSACCIGTGGACQESGFPPAVPCCSGSCASGTCR